MSLTNEVKEHALSSGADLVGIAGIDRYENAPVMMRPQGLLPEARSVVVMALHHPDGCIEMGGDPHPQDIGPYTVQYTMNSMLDELSFRMGRFLEDAGWDALPIVSSNIWRYRGYEGLREHFAPDVSHIHAAVAAGLADFGYSGLAMTPEYGPRNRFVQVITTARLEATPLLQETLCDDCGLCRKHCLSGALTEEIDGWNEVKISGRTFRYANKNLWRCAWGEHFDIDLDLELPARVDEETILDAIEEHGQRGGEFGSCLRYCLPKHLRYFDRSYTTAPRRRKEIENPPARPRRKVMEQINGVSSVYGCEGAIMLSSDKLASCGIDPSKFLPDARSGAVVYFHLNDHIPESGRIRAACQDKANFAAYRIARILEDEGYSVVCESRIAPDDLDHMLSGTDAEGAVSVQTVFTSASLPDSDPTSAVTCSVRPDKGLKHALHDRALRSGVDLFGVAPADRLTEIAGKLRPVYANRTVLNARDRNRNFQPFDPEITEEPIEIKTPEDTLPGPESVIVLGLHYNSAPVQYAAEPPAKTVGPYVFSRYESQFLLTRYALDVVAMLESGGYRAAVSFDPLGTGGYTASVRGNLYDKFSCRFAAISAGLATITRSGIPATKNFGINQVFVAVVTDAELEADDLEIYDSCGDCQKCLQSCPVGAFRNPVQLEVDGQPVTFADRDYRRCDWDKRYFLPAESGFGVMGSPVDLHPPDEVSTEELDKGLRKHDPITKGRPSIAEKCVVVCPLGAGRA